MSTPLTPPAPPSGTCMNGGVLGDGKDTRLFLVTRGATRLITELTPSDGTFTRELQATSTLSTSAAIGGRPDAPDARSWDLVVPWATEFLVTRDSRDAWGGPVTEAVFSVGDVKSTAADLSAWWDRRRTIGAVYTDEDASVIFVKLHESAMAVDPVANWHVSSALCHKMTSRTYLASDEGYVVDDLRELADTYVDWTMYSRTLIACGPEIRSDSFLLLTDEMWSTPPLVKLRGNDQATRVIVKGKDGLVAVATADQAHLDYYGLLERVFEESSIADQASLNANAKARLEMLQDPTYIETPTNATLLPSAPISFSSLIPGLRVRVHATATPRQLVADFRLSKVTAGFDGKVSIDLQPLGTIDSMPMEG